MASGHDTRAAKRYATALFQIAQKSDSIDTVEKDIEQVVDLMHTSARLHDTWLSPLMPASLKRRVINQAFTEQGSDAKPGEAISPLTLSFLDLLIDKGREEVLTDVARELRYLADIARHQIRVMAVFAVEPTEAERIALTRSLEARTNSHVQLTYHVDAGILGGVIVHLQDTLIDGSVRGTLERLREQMLAE